MTISGLGNEFATRGRTYRLVFLTAIESTTRPVPDQPPVTNGSTWDCPPDGLDQFYPRGRAMQVSLTCQFTAKFNRRVMGPQPLTVSFSDLGDAHDTTH